MNTSKLLTVMIGLQVLTLAGQYLGQPSVVAPAMAQMPDAGAQRAQIIEELKGIRTDLKALTATNAATASRVDKMAVLLDSGTLQVKSVSPDDNRKHPGK